MIIVTTGKYSKKRKDEFLKCFRTNISYDFITKYVYFYESGKNDQYFLNQLETFNKEKIEIIKIKSRIFINEMLKYVNEKYPNEICILTNNDIVFHKNITNICSINFDKCNIVLTRYNIHYQIAKYINSYFRNKKFYKLMLNNILLSLMPFNGRSVDTWIFKLPIKPDDSINLPLGTLFCDNILSQFLSKNKPTFNPCFDIISIHLHSNWSPYNYSKKISSSRQYMQNSDELEDITKYFAVKYCKLDKILDKFKKI